MTPNQSEAEELRKHFEANMLDGDRIQKGQMLAATEVFAYIQELLTERRTQARRDELVKAAPHQVALFFQIPASELNASWYLEYVKLRDAELLRLSQAKDNTGKDA